MHAYMYNADDTIARGMKTRKLAHSIRRRRRLRLLLPPPFYGTHYKLTQPLHFGPMKLFYPNRIKKSFASKTSIDFS